MRIIHTSTFLSKIDCAKLIFEARVSDITRLIDNYTFQQLWKKPNLVRALLDFHALTGCGFTSAFVHLSKSKPFKLVSVPESEEF